MKSLRRLRTMKKLPFIGALTALTLVAGLAFTVPVTAETNTAEESGRHYSDTDPRPLYLQLNEGHDRAYLRMLGRLGDKESVHRISGSGYIRTPGDQYAPDLTHGEEIFGFEGFSIRRLYRVPGTNDIALLTREIVYYTDPSTGEILTEWTNPLDGVTRPVVPIVNEHVNRYHRVVDGDLKAVYGNSVVPLDTTPQAIQDDRIWSIDVAPNYSLQSYGIDDNFGLPDGQYSSQEMFDYRATYADLWYDYHRKYWVGNDQLPVQSSWARTSPWLPFMCVKQADYPGGLTFHARSWTLEEFDDLDDPIKSTTEQQYPVFTSAPSEVDSSPNDTSWSTFYKNQLGSGQITWENWCSGQRV